MKATSAASLASSSAFSRSSSESSFSSSLQLKGATSSRMKTWGGRENIGKGRGGCTGLGGGEGMLLSRELGALSEELEVCFGELEPMEERFDIFVGVKVL